ncbi:SMI1/KNR4 family protein [Kitasatospora sp. NPDC091335]|uniref:SMI1/KNR4 family protein n=1 Tax=Kitasatospora sp. NPDC091335 TaxID=3364085 RepID=UPI0037F51D0C
MRADPELLRDLIATTPGIVTWPGRGRPEAAIRSAESVTGPLPRSYRWWLAAYGEGSLRGRPIATVDPVPGLGEPPLGEPGLTEEWSGGDRLWFHEDDDHERYGFALDRAADGEWPVVVHSRFTDEEQPVADSFAGFLTVWTALAAGLREGPNPAVARLWRATPGVRLPDGGTLLGPHTFRARNDAWEVRTYAPHWVLVGEEGGGAGLFMRRHGRDRSSLYRLGPGPLRGEVADHGELLGPDLFDWLDRLPGP